MTRHPCSRSPVLAALVLAATAAPAAAQGDVLHYRFDATDTNRVLNFADGAQAAPKLGALTAPWTAYTDGVHGGALRASFYVGTSGNRVDTGWTGGHTGSLTIAFALQNRMANSATEYSPVAGQPGWSIATGGSAGAGLQLRGVCGADLNGDFGLPVCSMPGWNHFAVVVDAAAGTATWYRNGSVASTAPIGGGAVLPVDRPLLVGTDYVTWCGSLYDIDEFRMLARAATATEVHDWATTVAPRATTFGASAAADLQAAGLPAIGNASFGVRVQGTAQRLFVLAAGLGYEQWQGLPLPLDPATLLPVRNGALLQVAVDVATIGVLDGEGRAERGLPLPPVPGLRGAGLYLQAFVLRLDDGLDHSAALALSIGE